MIGLIVSYFGWGSWWLGFVVAGLAIVLLGAVVINLVDAVKHSIKKI
jgi:hypothetical protein